MFKGTALPSCDGSHFLVKEISICSSVSIITSNFVPFILLQKENSH